MAAAMTQQGAWLLILEAVHALQDVFSGLLIPAAIFFLLSFAVKGRGALRAWRESLPSTWTNILLIGFNRLAIFPVIVLLSEFIEAIPVQLIVANWWLGVPKILVILLALLVGDFAGYWRHRLEHSRWLWPSHAIHHSDRNMTWLALERFHPFNRLITFVIDHCVLILLGFPLYAVFANNLLRHCYGYFIHADLPWDYSTLGRFFVSPVMHRWHHAADPAAHHTNYATIFSIFDRWFGTYRVPGPCDALLGVSDKTLGGGFASQLVYPLKANAYRR